MNNEILELINKYPKLGNMTVLDLDQARASHTDVRDTDICVFYDYCTDEASDDENDSFVEWLCGHTGGNILDVVTQFMRHNGYEKIDDVDGSGGGLYYGSLQFRKKIR